MTKSTSDRAPPPIQTDMFAPDACEYDLDFIINNPILAICSTGKTRECKGKTTNINAPELGKVRCFWCGGAMKPADQKTYQERLANLWQHVSKD